MHACVVGTPMGSAHAQTTEIRAFVVYVCSSILCRIVKYSSLIFDYIGDQDVTVMSLDDPPPRAARAVSAVNQKLPPFWPADPHL